MFVQSATGIDFLFEVDFEGLLQKIPKSASQSQLDAIGSIVYDTYPETLKWCWSTFPQL